MTKKRPTTRTPPISLQPPKASRNQKSDPQRQTDFAQFDQDQALKHRGSPSPNAKSLINQLGKGSSPDEPFTVYDPIETAMLRHPLLTRETAEEMEKAFGF